jgi:hypothetical protein
MVTPSSGQSPRKRKIREQQLKVRAALWPTLDVNRLWSRTTHKGFTTLPRTFPMLMLCIDDMSKGQPLGRVYLDLWCRMFDESFVSLSRTDEMAYSAGFTGQRAVTMWRERLRRLANLDFIATASGASGDLSYALIFNPYLVLKQHHSKKTPGLTARAYDSLKHRAVEVGENALL